MSAWNGDISELGRLVTNLRRLSEIPSRASRKAAEGIAGLIDEQFERSTDPYGAPWAPLAESTIARKGSDKILEETDKLRDGIRVAPTAGAGVQITSEAEYAGFHQVGREDMPARPILPTRGLPRTWQRIIDDALDDAFDEALR